MLTSEQIASEVYPDDVLKRDALIEKIESYAQRYLAQQKRKKPLSELITNTEARQANRVRQRDYKALRSSYYQSWAPLVYGIDYVWIAMLRAIRETLKQKPEFCEPAIFKTITILWSLKNYHISTKNQDFTLFDFFNWHTKFVFQVKGARAINIRLNKLKEQIWPRLLASDMITPSGFKKDGFVLTNRARILLGYIDTNLLQHLQWPVKCREFVNTSDISDQWYLVPNKPTVKAFSGANPRLVAPKKRKGKRVF